MSNTVYSSIVTIFIHKKLQNRDTQHYEKHKMKTRKKNKIVYKVTELI